jgi:hypothetical protein
MLETYNNSFVFSNSSYDYDDTSSLDSGIERSFETNDIQITSWKPRKLNFDGTKLKRKSHYRNPKVSLEEFQELEKEFQPCVTDTSTPEKPKRRYAQGKSRISRSQNPAQITKIKKYRRIKANDRERNRMHSLNEALGECNAYLTNDYISILESKLLIPFRASTTDTSNISRRHKVDQN